MGRTNPIHTMLRTGTDAYSGVLDKRGIRAADDMVTMPLQCGTQWDGLGHIFYENYMWNGYDCREVTSAGAQKCGIEKTKNKMVGRGVFLDVARALGKESLEDGYGITCEDLDKHRQGARRRRSSAATIVIVRTGQMERCLKAGSWDGYPGGDAPGFAFETLEWVTAHRARRARERHLGLRGAAEQDRGRHQPALALDHDPDHGHDHGRDLLSEGARRGLRAPTRSTSSCSSRRRSRSPARWARRPIRWRSSEHGRPHLVGVMVAPVCIRGIAALSDPTKLPEGARIIHFGMTASCGLTAPLDERCVIRLRELCQREHPMNFAINPLIAIGVVASTASDRRGLCVLQRGGVQPPPRLGRELELDLVHVVRVCRDQLHRKRRYTSHSRRWARGMAAPSRR